MLRVITSKETRQIAVVTESERNWYNLNNTSETSRHCRNKKRE
jgi:hypothetical protein